MKSLDFFKSPGLRKDLNLARTLNLAASILRSDLESRVNHQAKGNVYMYDSIQLSKTASFRTTSQVTWPNDSKAAGNCFHALSGGLRRASLILGWRIAFPLVLLGAGLALIQPCAGQSGTWTATGSLAHAGFIIRTATLLPNGKVLVVGSYPVYVYPHLSYLPGAELYDPASGTWAATGIPVTLFNSPRATLLPNGNVLVAGVSAGVSAELYDPASGTWSATGSLRTARDEHTMTLLPNGKVLVVGGLDVNKGGSIASAELYDPARGTWAATRSLNTARLFHSATLLPNGKVLVAGGAGTVGLPLASAELYDPASGTWSTTGSLATGRFLHTETLLPNGKVLVAGGEGGDTGGPLASAELYDPASGTWTTTGSLNTAREEHTMTLLPNGKALVAGGTNVSAELYDPASGTWTATGSLGTARFSHTATLLPDGNVLVAGGWAYSGGPPVASAELYDTSVTTPSATLRNISTRASVQTGQGVAIAGFIVTGTGPKQVLIRGLGPTLTNFNVTGVLADPTLGLYDGSGTPISSNNDWKNAQQAAIQATGLAPSFDVESAILITLQPGNYTAILGGNNGTTGVGLVEVYDMISGGLSELTNVSTRGLVGTDQNVVIAGFIADGGNGSTQVVVRGLGPTLAQPQFGVSGTLADPVVTLVDGNGNVVQTNDNWKNTQQAAIQATELAPPNDLEAAILAPVAAGNYTAILSGNGGTGIGLVEVYKLP
jgi:Galactose oxidase, central domain